MERPSKPFHCPSCAATVRGFVPTLALSGTGRMFNFLKLSDEKIGRIDAFFKILKARKTDKLEGV